MSQVEEQSFEQRVSALSDEHRKRTGAQDFQIFQAPGRVNLLGEHTDYSGGFCMPAALDYNTLVAASPRSDTLLRLYSLDFQNAAEFHLDDLQRKGKEEWSSYPAGVAWSLGLRGIKVAGADLTFSGNVPLGAGLSSSASIEVATATALLALAGAELPRPQVALACQKAENDFVGAPCGIMDQYIAACGVKGNALAIDTRALTSELAPIPAHLRLVVCNSMVQHSVGDGKYGARRHEVEEAARAIARKLGRDEATFQLRDATLQDLFAAKDTMSHEAFLRGRHVITDSERVHLGVAGLQAGDARVFGALMTDAHASFRDDFQASCDRCDLLVRLAMSLEGCLGSRLTGGGFGGCTVSLVETAQAEPFAKSLADRYREATGVEAPVFVCKIADGAGPVKLG